MARMSTEDQNSVFEMSATDQSSDGIIEHTSEDYAQYLTLDVSVERQQFDESIEELLTRLDEYLGLVDLIRSDTNLCLGRTLPQIQSKAVQMEKVFERIDQLEAFVGVVRQNMNTMETLVSQAESEMGTFSSIRKIFNNISMPSFLSSKQKQSRVQTPKPTVPTFSPPQIFRTTDYLNCTPEDITERQPGRQPRAASMVVQTAPRETPPKIEEAAVIIVKPRDDTGPTHETSPATGTWPAIGDTQ